MALCRFVVLLVPIVPSEGDLDGLPKLEVDEREKKVWSALFKRVAEESQSFKQRLISALVVAVHHDEGEAVMCVWERQPQPALWRK